MSEYELILQDLCVICQQTFRVTTEQAENSINTPLFTINSNLNALDTLYFLLEIIRKFNVSLSSDMMENSVKLSLSELATEVIRCKQYNCL